MIKRYTALLALLAAVAFVLPAVGERQPSSARFAVGRVHQQFDPSKGKIFILVIGNDARFGNPDRSLADAIHLVGVNTRTMKGGVLNFPRDSWVSIPGWGAGKINEALYAAGPQGVARTVEKLTGIRVDYWVMVGFQGFRNIIKRVGPVPIRIHRDIYDPRGSGAKIEAGKRRLLAGSALAFTRARKPFSRGDLARTTNQGRFLIALLRKLRHDTRRNPAALLTWLSAGNEYARFNVSAQELFRLGVLATRLKPRNVGNVTVPASLGWVGPASVVYISPAARSIYARFRAHASL